MSDAEPDYLGKNDPRNMPRHFFWKVRRDYSTAQRANVSNQNFCVFPRFWYIDATARCQNCNAEFEFTADEQRFWYEEMKFYVDAFPTRCPKCRKLKRKKLELRKQYDSSIAAALGRCATDRKKDAVRLINEIESLESKLSAGMLENRRVLISQISRVRIIPQD